ncbi:MULTISPECIES: TetR/AcrR family transcriptional regulator [Bacteroides]|uniref:TetR/AcrR family transcriptional regulator n=1 Tax=Bacteroides TaxID=816 RepID=UPI00189A8BB4|nr:TetR/AcrR family transcriptional regulator [Bacteroides fragilis]
MKKVDKKQWFVVGLDVLAKDGFARIRIDNLCGLLQITKGAFYHHFKNIDGYIDALMEYWLEVNTFEFIREVDKLNDTTEQLQKLGDMAAYSSIRDESVIRAWGYSNPIVRSYVSQADRIRLDYAAKLNEANGLDVKQAKDMAVLQYSLLIGMQQVCSDLSPEQFKELQDVVINKFKE